MTTKVQLRRVIDGGMEDVNPITSDDCVNLQNGKKLSEFVSSIENDEFSPTITQISTMSKVGVGENDVDISANVQEGYVKSAILKGCTKYTNDNGDVFDTFFNPVTEFIFTNAYLQADGTLINNSGHFATQFIDVTNFDGIEIGKDGTYYGKLCFYDSDKNFISWVTKDGTTGIVKVKSIPSNAKYIRYSATTKDIFIKDNEGRDLALPLSLASVKLPVLTTVGKNLLDVKKFNFNDNSDFTLNGNTITCNYTKENSSLYLRLSDLNLKPNTAYRLSANCSANVWIGGMINHDSSWKWADNNTSSITFTTPNNLDNVLLVIKNISDLTSATISNIQLEEGSTATSYEPYKTNILTVNEDIELRGIGDVKDTLDCLTGEVTEYIDKIVLDGGEDKVFIKGPWDKENTVAFYMVLDETANTSIRLKILCDKLKNANDFYNSDEECILCTANVNGTIELYIRLLRSRLANVSVSSLKSYLSENPIIVLRQRIKPIIKTVDLTPGGTNPTTKPYVWDGGHIQLSSEEGSLTPSLEYSVTTSRGGQIIQNTQSIAKQDKRVYDLEMLLINASIDEAYKRLILQNDVMVMNRECQTVASPLRYIMLQRLIEEKAYETQDMLDKLDVFFMYGEITDEQYFELFDIVLGIMTDTDLDITEEVE